MYPAVAGPARRTADDWADARATAAFASACDKAAEAQTHRAGDGVRRYRCRRTRLPARRLGVPHSHWRPRAPGQRSRMKLNSGVGLPSLIALDDLFESIERSGPKLGKYGAHRAQRFGVECVEPTSAIAPLVE